MGGFRVGGGGGMKGAAELSTKKQKLSTFRLISYLKNPFIIFTKSTFFRPCLVTYG